MVPIRDSNPRHQVPYVTYCLILLNLFVFGYEFFLSESALEVFFKQFAVIPKTTTENLDLVLQGKFQNLGALYPLITALFLHAGWLHLGGNMLYLWVFGDNVEDRMGHAGFLAFYLLCGLGATLIQLFFDPLSKLPNLGASGAIAGVLGAYVIRFPRAKVLMIIPLGWIPIPFEIRALYFLGWWFVQQFFFSLLSLGVAANVGMEKGGIAYWAHAGGFVVGAILLTVFDRRRTEIR